MTSTANRLRIARENAIPTSNSGPRMGKGKDEPEGLGSFGGKRIVGSAGSWFRTHLTIGRVIA